MSLKKALNMMTKFAPSVAATNKFKKVLPEGFVWYRFEWLGDSDIMKVQGSTTRIARSGKNKGEPIIDKNQSIETVYITESEIQSVEIQTKE